MNFNLALSIFLLLVQFRDCYQPTENYIPAMIRVRIIAEKKIHKESLKPDSKEKRITTINILKNLFITGCLKSNHCLHYGDVAHARDLILNTLGYYITKVCVFDHPINEYIKFINDFENSKKINLCVQNFIDGIRKKSNFDVSYLNRLKNEYTLIDSFEKWNFIYYSFTELFINSLSEEIIDKLLDKKFIIINEVRDRIDNIKYSRIILPLIEEIELIRTRFLANLKNNRNKILHVISEIDLIFDFINMTVNFEKNNIFRSKYQANEDEIKFKDPEKNYLRSLKDLKILKERVEKCLKSHENTPNHESHINEVKNSFSAVKSFLNSMLHNENLINQVSARFGNNDPNIYICYLKYRVQNLIYNLDVFLIADFENIKLTEETSTDYITVHSFELVSLKNIES